MSSPSSPEAPEVGAGAPLSALLIDFGGVLTTPISDAFGALSAEAGLAAGEALSLLAGHEGARTALREHEEGRLDDEGFEDAFAQALAESGGRMEARGLLARIEARMRLDEPMVELVREVRRQGVPVALVSNSLGRNCYARVDLDELFDVTVISGRVGVRKPSRRIYAMACEQLGVPPEQCVLVDDLEHNLVGAARLGIVGIHHRQAGETADRVRELLDLPATTTATP
ncbi:HAD family hydrolase [Janibacter cremeus]|uniref:Putative hydrolase of the HAD superfamily n=1 Tax=Janibacter cremeus TaxID=1285192 RepID=A0A852VKU6_9MICO|nr:HAD family phosphatase [Janibacter cremeus]NYF97707.1 putative hydrolase of the HAD superfamily [Janibacter cremeus]